MTLWVLMDLLMPLSCQGSPSTCASLTRPCCCLQCRAGKDTCTARRRQLEKSCKAPIIWYPSIGQGLSETTASPSLGKRLERNQEVPNKCSCTGCPAQTSLVCEEARPSQPIFPCNGNCPSSLHTSLRRNPHLLF